jgi:integrase
MDLYESNSVDCSNVKNARALLNSIWTDPLEGLRDRALISVMLFYFARVSAVLGMRVSDFYENGCRRWFRLLEKGSKHHEVPVHHRAHDYVAEYLEKAGFQPNALLFQTFRKKKPTGRAMSRSEAYRMIRCRAIDTGVFALVCCHSFRATGITVYFENRGLLRPPRRLRRTRALVLRSFMIEPTTNLHLIRWERFRFDDNKACACWNLTTLEKL